MPSDRYTLNNLYTSFVREQTYSDYVLLTEVKLSTGNIKKLVDKYARKIFKYNMGDYSKESSYLFKSSNLIEEYYKLFKNYSKDKIIKILKATGITEEQLQELNNTANINSKVMAGEILREKEAAYNAYIAVLEYEKIIEEIKNKNISLKSNFLPYLDNIILNAVAPRNLSLNYTLPPNMHERQKKTYTQQETKVYRDLIEFLLNNEININRTAIPVDVLEKNKLYMPDDIKNYFSNDDEEVFRILNKNAIYISNRSHTGWSGWLARVDSTRTAPLGYVGDAITYFNKKLPEIEPLRLSQNVKNILNTRNLNPEDFFNTPSLYRQYRNNYHDPNSPIMGQNDTFVLLRQVYQKALSYGFAQEYVIADAVIKQQIANSARNPSTDAWIMFDPDQGTLKRNDRKIIFCYTGFENYVYAIIYVFNKMQSYLPNKDIFGYNSLNELLRALLNAQSQRSIKKRYTKVVPSDLEKSVVYKDNNVLVVRPLSWEVSRKYFGHDRPSFINPEVYVRGSSWCTASSHERFFNIYTEKKGQNLYYFADLKDDSLWALVTSGQDKQRESMLHVWRDKENNNDFIYKNFTFESFCYNTTEEARSQDDKLIEPQVIYSRFNLSVDWRKNYIEYMAGIDNKKFTK